MAINWDEFDKNVDIENLEKDVEEAATKEYGEFEDVPFGKYEVKINKLELTKSKKDSPMLSVWFEIINNETYNGRLIFMNQLVTEGFQIHIANEFLRSLKTDENVEFKGYSAYNILILNIYEKIADNEYELEYKENKKGFKTFKIIQMYNINNEEEFSSQEVKDELGW